MLKAARLFIGAGTLVSGFALAPLSAARAADAAPLQGNVSSSTIDVSVSPGALLNGLPGGLGNTLNAAGLGRIGIRLDDAAATGVLTGARNDLQTGSSSAQAVDIKIAALDGLLRNLSNQIAVLNTAPSALSGLAPQLNQVVGSLTAPVNGLAGTSDITQAVSALLDAGHPTGSTQGVSGVSLTPASGISLNLAPFRATAVNAAGLKDVGGVAGITAPQAEAHSTTQSLRVDQSLSLATQTLTNLITTVQGVISTLTNAASQTAVPTVVNVLNSAPAPASTVTGLIASQLSSGTVTIASAQTTVNGALDQAKALLTTLDGLTGLSNLSLNGLADAEGVSSTSLLQPQSNGVHGLATSAFTDLKLLQVIPDKLNGLGILPVPAGTPLIEVKGAQSSADALVDGVESNAPAGSSRLGEIDVLGIKALDLNSAIPPGTSKSLSIGVPGTPLGVTLQVTAGVPVIANSSPTHKSVQVGALEVALYNGGSGLSPIPLLGGGVPLASTGVLSHAQLAATGTDAIVKASFASSAVDVAAGPLNSSTASSPQTQGQLPKTGLLGPAALTVGVAVLAVGLGLRLAPAAIGRIRRNRQ